MKIFKNKFWIISMLAVLAILAVWEIIARIIDVQIILPTLSDVAVALWGLVGTASFYSAVGSSLLRCLLSFLVAFVMGVALGIIGGASKEFAAVMRPIIAAARTVPTMAIVLLLMLTVKDLAPAVIGWLLVFPVIYQTVKTAVENVDIRLLEMAKVDGVDRLQTVRYIYFPVTLPYILGAISSALGMCIKGVISAEILAYTGGSIGEQMSFAYSDSVFESTPTLFAWVIVVLLLSVSVEGALKLGFRQITKRAADKG